MHARYENPMTSMTEPQERTGIWAELFLCLGRAFLPPAQAQFRHALSEALPEDLRELNTGAHFTDEPTLATFESAISTIDADSEELLVVYSGLFLSPPTPACLNAGMHIDGTIMGNSVQEMEQLYQKYALAKDAEFRDLPDHLALQLQFLGYLLALSLEHDAPRDTLADARGFIERYLLNWIPALAQQCRRAEQTVELPAVYSSLSAMTADALVRVCEHLPLPAPGPDSGTEEAPADRDVPANGYAQTAGEAASCSRCGKPFAAGSELTTMIAKLRDKGLDTDHLAICPECRTASMGLHPVTPVGVKRTDMG
jgi:putative dimethyl sulfoxide reductase chaperone